MRMVDFTASSVSPMTAAAALDYVYDRLRQVIDPETHLNIVDMGLVRSVRLYVAAGHPKIWIQYTLTTPTCPLAGMFALLIHQNLRDLPDDLWLSADINHGQGVTQPFNPETDAVLELSFEPPWTRDDLSPLAKAELGL